MRSKNERRCAMAAKAEPTPPVPTTRILTRSGFYLNGCLSRLAQPRYAANDFGERRSGVSVSATTQKQFIGGEFVDSTSGETMEVLNPATGEVIAVVPRGTAEDVERAVDAAPKAWSAWQDRLRRTGWSPAEARRSSTRTRKSSHGSSRSTSVSPGGLPSTSRP
jgi:hypothetical protein